MSKTLKDRKRREQVEAGAYDGRYITKVVESKKRKEERKNRRLHIDRILVQEETDRQLDDMDQYMRELFGRD